MGWSSGDGAPGLDEYFVAELRQEIGAFRSALELAVDRSLAPLPREASV